MSDPVKQLDAGKGAPVLSEIPRYDSYDPRPYADTGFRIPRLNLVLFLLTLLTTTMAGAYMAGADLSILHPLAGFGALASGLSFSIPLMAILLAHELGHYITSRHYGVDASLPYFIPAPFPSFFFTGTFGAMIRMRSVPNSRRIMFDIGAAGPWAGMLIALPATIIGLHYSAISPLEVSSGGLNLGNSLLFLGLSKWILGVDPNAVNINLHPIAFAGWLGFFVTTLNLVPSGQFDGGHVIYALFGRHHRTISRFAVLFCVLMVIVPFILSKDYWGGWLLWAVILLFVGLGHPTTLDAETPLDLRRRIAAWATVALFIVTFTPVPLSFAPPSAPIDKDKVYQVMQPDSVPATIGRLRSYGCRI
ncbi:MAG: site-2 protease family protein [Candidatus Binataceae bacterium]|nr:site-2 protease family protein [Candidatus Binataceae bacterium]